MGDDLPRDDNGINNIGLMVLRREFCNKFVVASNIGRISAAIAVLR
jgi:hypothetical protein